MDLNERHRQVLVRVPTRWATMPDDATVQSALQYLKGLNLVECQALPLEAATGHGAPVWRLTAKGRAIRAKSSGRPFTVIDGGKGET